MYKKDKVLALLGRKGKHGATQQELNRIAYRYGGLIHTLRGEGFDIETKQLGLGKFRYYLKEEDESNN